MIKFSDWITNRVEKFFYHTHSAGQIKNFVLKKYGRVVNRLGTLDEQNKTEIAYDLWQIYEILLVLGWVNLKKNPFNTYSSKKQVSLSELMAWEKELWDGKAIRIGVVKAGAGFYLDQADLKEKVFRDSFVSDNLESLLKHIETRREHSLQNFDPVADTDSLWLERLNIVLLFARAARRKKDPRFLNAALKLNDLYFSNLKRKSTLPEMVRFLLALVEQELTFKELYP
jgi:hypothetical protein